MPIQTPLMLTAILRKKKALETYTKKYGIENLYDPRHHYNYLGAMEAGVVPTKWEDLPLDDRLEDLEQVQKGLRRPIPRGTYMWPDRFKLLGHEVPSKRGWGDKMK